METQTPIGMIREFNKYYKAQKGDLWLDGVDDYYTQLAYNTRNEVIAKIVNELNPPSILDIGCGMGDLVLKLDNHARLIRGVEPSLANAIKFMKNTGYQAYNDTAEDIKHVADRSFHLAIMADVIEHVYDPYKAIGEALRVLKVGGHLIITTPNKFAEIVCSIGGKRFLTKMPVNEKLLSPHQLRKLVKKQPYDTTLIQWNMKGVYPRSAILSKVFDPKNKNLCRLLDLLDKFEVFRYRHIVMVNKLKW